MIIILITKQGKGAVGDGFHHHNQFHQHQHYYGDHHSILSNQENGEGGDGFHVTASEKALQQVLTYFGIWYIVESYQRLSSKVIIKSYY